MASKLAPRPPPVAPPSPAAPAQSLAVASVRKNSAPHHHGHHGHHRRRNENNDSDSAVISTSRMKVSPINSSSKALGSSKHPESFPVTKLLLQAVEDAVCSGALQGGRAAEQALLNLVGAAKHELKGNRRHIAQLEVQNRGLEGECLRYKTSVCKIQTQSENLRRSSRGKDAVCNAQLQKLVVLLREVQGYEEEPELSEDEQQQEPLKPLKSSNEASGEDGDGSDSDDAQLGSSNQSEEDQPGSQDSDIEAARHGDSEVAELHQRDAVVLKHRDSDDDNDRSSGSSSKSGSVSGQRLGHAAALSVTVAEPMKKVIKEPKPPRGSSGTGGVRGARSSEPRNSRLKFQFLDVELGDIGEGDFELDDDADDKLAARHGDPTTSPSRASSTQRRRFSSSAVISTAVPLRRKSFTMKRSPGKRIAVAAAEDVPASAEALAPPSRWAARRKSTSTCYYPPRSASNVSNASLRSPAKWKLDQRRSSTQDAAARRDSGPLAAPSPRSSQMVVRVRERKVDGVPELVICKKPARFVVWQWSDRQVRIPFMIQLGPQQHGVMLRQLRYVKSVMHDFPWAKAHLKELLAAYTKKDMTKEQLYPQLNHLSHHVQEEVGGKAKRQRALAAKKHHLTLQLTLAAGAVNELRMVKFGRRGKPHETRLCYDPSDPTRLHWLRKNGDKSDESLAVDEIDVRDSQLDSSVLKRAARKFPLDPASCVTLTTAARSLDLQLKDPLQRDWLVNALKDIISFARQYKAAGALGRRVQSQKNLLAAGR